MAIFFQFCNDCICKDSIIEYVNSMNCILRLLLGPIGEFDWYDSPLTHKRFIVTHMLAL